MKIVLFSNKKFERLGNGTVLYLPPVSDCLPNEKLTPYRFMAETFKISSLYIFNPDTLFEEWGNYDPQLISKLANESTDFLRIYVQNQFNFETRITQTFSVYRIKKIFKYGLWWDLYVRQKPEPLKHRFEYKNFQKVPISKPNTTGNFIDSFFKKLQTNTFQSQLQNSISEILKFKLNFYEKEKQKIEKLIQNANESIQKVQNSNSNVKVSSIVSNYESLIVTKTNLDSIIETIHTRLSELSKNFVSTKCVKTLNLCSKLKFQPQILETICKILYSFACNWKFPTKIFCNFAFLGPTGIGKTFCAKIVAQILSEFGLILKPDVFVATRSSLIGEYIGQTAIKVRTLCISNLESVLFIDEAYSLGYSESMKDFGNEAITELVHFEDEYQGFYVHIVAGYKDLMENQFFSKNEGLRRRFVYKCEMEEYSIESLTAICCEKISELIDLTKQDVNLVYSHLIEIQGYVNCNAGTVSNLAYDIVSEYYVSDCNLEVAIWRAREKITRV